MKLGLSPLVLSILGVLLFSTSEARASPRGGGGTSQEDLLADGDVDVEDIATRSPFASVSSPIGMRRVLGGSNESPFLSLVGFSRKTIDDQREVGGFVVLGLPLDRFARSRPRVVERPEIMLASAGGPTVGLNASPRVAGAIETQFELALTSRLARSCVAAAWRAAGLGTDDGRLDAIVSRARWSALLPEARLRAVRFEDARLSLDTSTDTSKLRDSSGANIGFEARLTWRFDRLVYADDEPSFERIRIEQRDARSRVAAKVLEALFHWQRAALDLRTLPPAQQGTRDEADVVLRVMEAEAALDVLTNGWFANEQSRKRSRAPHPQQPQPSPANSAAGGAGSDL